MPTTRSSIGLLLVILYNLLNPTHAEWLTTQQVIDPHQMQLSRIQQALAHEEVQKALAHYGVTEQQAHERLSTMTDQEIAMLANRLEQLPAGGDAGTVVTVLLIAVILEIFGITDLFTFL